MESGFYVPTEDESKLFYDGFKYKIKNIMSKIDYEEEPIWYCKSCLSMRILNSSGTDEDIDGDPTPCYCDDCGCTDIAVTEKYGIKEIEDLKNKRLSIKKRI